LVPWVFLIPEAGDIEVRHPGRVQLADPRFRLAELVVVAMLEHAALREVERGPA
jgi:hypothetical protein